MKDHKQAETRRLVVVSVLMLASPVPLIISWLVWQNWHRMDAFDAVFFAAIPAMFIMQFGLDWLVARPSVKRLTVRIPLKDATRKHLLQTAPFVIFVFAAALATIPQLIWWDVMLRLMWFWFVVAAAIEIWSRYRARAKTSKMDLKR